MRLPELRLWKPRQAGPEDNDDGGGELGGFDPENNAEEDNDEEGGDGEEGVDAGEGIEGEEGGDDNEPDVGGPGRPEGVGDGDEGIEVPTLLPSDRPTAGGSPPTPPLTLPSTSTP